MNTGLFPQRMSSRSFAVLLLHGLVFALVYWLAFSVRFEFELSREDWTLLAITGPAIVLIKSMVFYSFGHCHRSWHYVSFSDLVALLRSATISVVIVAALDGLLVNTFHPPRLVLAMDWALTILVLGGLQAVSRLSREELSPRLWRTTFRKALIVGANQSGETLARHLMADHRLKYLVAGFLDQDPARHGSTVGGIPVLGDPQRALSIAHALGVEDILVISGVLTGVELRGLMENCSQSGVALKVIPAYDDLLATSYTAQIRDVDINDLLRREPVQLNNDAISTLVGGRTVLVTGAGGSIGSEICRQVLKFRPSTLVMVERSENSLFLVEQEFRALRTEAQVIPCIADITDCSRIDQIFRLYRPAVVFHAAAHKHVPMMEYNPGEAIKNNVLGTRSLAELADQHGVQEFVMISTDKAVNPTSVMGVSKQLAERFVHAFSEVANTKFVVVRFGNVLASNGSVVPIFQEQIRHGGPITVTHPEIERFFMTIPEASQLVLQAAAMGKGGEIFVLDMGESVRIVDLARDLIRLSGLNPDDIEIKFTGLRPGEKLYEELYFEDEEMQPTPHPKVFVAYHRPYKLDEVRDAIGALLAMAHESSSLLRCKIKELVPEYESQPAPAAPVAEVAAGPEETNGVHLPQRRTNQRTSVAET
ncbi:MAG: polysaccharide biosynthesis protein [Planctomycetia bacterium]|nr:polysaccharide biosynthesis protein [Planctomycetia bacterium]